MQFVEQGFNLLGATIKRHQNKLRDAAVMFYCFIDNVDKWREPFYILLYFILNFRHGSVNFGSLDLSVLM